MDESRSRSTRTVLVLSVWLGMLIWAHAFVATYGLRIPIADDGWLFDGPPGQGLTWQALWSLHNEHRLPLPKAIQFGVYALTGDLRACMHLQVLILGAVSLAMIATARKVRGWTSLSDAFFPLVWLHTGNRQNLLVAFQLAFTVPTALVSIFLIAVVVSPRVPSTRRAIACALALLGLPLCGGIGITQVVPLAAWASWVGIRARRSSDEGERRGGRILVTACLLALSLVVLQAAWYQRPAWNYSFSPEIVVPKIAALLGFGFGPAAELTFPVSGILAVVLVGATVWLLLERLYRVPSERTRGGGIFALVIGALMLVATMSIARPRGGWMSAFMPQYATLTTPVLCAAYFAWTVLGPPRRGAWVTGILCAVTAIALPENARRGHERGEIRRSAAVQLSERIRDGAPAAELVELYRRSFEMLFPDAWRVLRGLASARLSPFDVHAPPDHAFDCLAFRRAPVRMDSPSTPTNRQLEGLVVLLVQADSSVHLSITKSDRRAVGSFGIPEMIVKHGDCGRLEVRIDLVSQDGTSIRLFERMLEPLASAADRGPQHFDFEIPPAVGAEIRFSTHALEGGPPGAQWSYWSDVAIN